MLDWRQRILDLLAGPGPLMVFQPIARLADEVVIGYEALARFPEDRLPRGSHDAGLADEAGLGFGPEVWFKAADEHDLGVDLEVAAVVGALVQLPSAPADCHISVNVGPETLVSGRLAAVTAGMDLRQVVVELTEHLVITDYGAVRAAVEALHRQHSLCSARIPRISADDMGAGVASLRHLAELGELLRFAKLDLSLTRAVDVDRSRRALVSALVRMGAELGFDIIAEGVEYEAQRDCLADLGVYAAQGWLIGRPGPLPRGGERSERVLGSERR